MGVRRHAEARDFGVNGTVSLQRRVERFDDQRGPTLAEDQTSAMSREWPTRVRGDDPQGVPGLQISEAERGLTAARYGPIHHAVTDHPVGMADRVARR